MPGVASRAMANLGGTRIDFTVTTRAGIRYAADSLQAVARDGDLEPCLAFVCSGHMMVLAADDIERIEAHVPRAAAGTEAPARGFCSHCDQPLPYGASSCVQGAPGWTPPT